MRHRVKGLANMGTADTSEYKGGGGEGQGKGRGDAEGERVKDGKERGVRSWELKSRGTRTSRPQGRFEETS